MFFSNVGLAQLRSLRKSTFMVIFRPVCYEIGEKHEFQRLVAFGK